MHLVSYSSTDARKFAIWLWQELEAGTPSVPVWIDQRNLDPGEDWDTQIQKAIKSCETLLLVMTHNAMNDRSVTKLEWGLARRYSKPIIPLRLHRDVEVPMLLQFRQWIDFSADTQDGLRKLRAHIAWLDTPEGKARQVEDQLGAARWERDRAQPDDWPRLDALIERLQDELTERLRNLDDPEAALSRTHERIEHGKDRERQEDPSALGESGPRVVNQPPQVPPDYFQDRRHETDLLAEYLRSETVRLIEVCGGEHLGKSAMVCRLLQALTTGPPPESGKIPLDGIIYLSAEGPHRVTARVLLGDLAEVLPAERADLLDKHFKDAQATPQQKLGELLQALASRRVVVVIDALESRIDPVTQRLVDPELETVLRLLLIEPTQHRVKVVITSRKKLGPFAEGQESAQEASRRRLIDLDEGLSPRHAERLLRRMDEQGRAGLRNASAELLDRARQRTGGNPLGLELLYSILSTDPGASLEQLLEETAKLPAEEVIEQFLIHEAFARLDPTSQRVVEALAVYGCPVLPEALDYLLEFHLDGLPNEPILDWLVTNQLARKHQGHYQLPAKYHDHALSRIPRGEPSDRELDEQAAPFTRFALLHRAANWFYEARRAPETYRRLEHLNAQLIEFDLRVRGEEYDTAAWVLFDIDHDYLLKWGHYREVLDRHRLLEDRLQQPGLAQASIGTMGNAAFWLGDYKAAIAYYARAIDLTQSPQDAGRRKRWTTNLGSAHYQLGHGQEARLRYEEALTMAQAAGLPAEEADPLAGLCLCYTDMGRFELAEQCNRRALEVAHDQGKQTLEAELLAAVGHLYGYQGRIAAARRYFGDALVLAEGLRYRLLEGHCYADLAELRVDERDWRDAADLAELAREINRAVGNPQVGRDANYVLALARLRSSDLRAARAAIDEACEHNPRRWWHPAHALQGIIALHQGRHELARSAFEREQAEAELAIEFESDNFSANDALGLGLLGMAVCGEPGFLDEADSVFRAARRITREAGVVDRTLRLLDDMSLVDQAGIVGRCRPAAAGAEPDQAQSTSSVVEIR